MKKTFMKLSKRNMLCALLCVAAAGASASASAQGITTMVLYNGGVGTSPQDSVGGQDMLQQQFGNSYSYTRGGRTISTALTYGYILNSDNTVGDVIQQKTAEANGTLFSNDTVVAETDALKKMLEANDKVLLVGFSQGTIYNNEDNATLIANGVDVSNLSMALVALVASVTDSTTNNGAYITSINDPVIKLVQAVWPKTLPGNINLSGTHNFEDYTKNQPTDAPGTPTPLQKLLTAQMARLWPNS